MSSNEDQPLQESGINKTLLIPLLLIVSVFGVLSIGFFLDDPRKLPSVLIDRPFPEFALSALHEPDRQLTKADITGQISLVNVWATWCPNCVIEHPELMRIAAEEDIPLFGLNYNDESPKAQRWLQRYGNPFQFNIVDDEGKLGIDLGIYGAPESFLLDANGVIQYKHIGIVNRDVWDNTLAPLIAELKAKEQP